MPSGTVYAPDTWQEVQASKTAPAAVGVSGTATAGMASNIDYTLTSDVLFRGLNILTSGAAFGDTITIEIIDSGGLVSPPGTILLTPVDNWNVPSDVQAGISYQAVNPKKALDTFTIRLIYTSVGMSNVTVAINYVLLNVLV